MKLSDAPYRGWSNYETYSVYMAFKGKWNKKAYSAYARMYNYHISGKREFIKILKEIFLDNIPAPKSPYIELIIHAAESVNWEEAAENLLEVWQK
jgi:hypothetical protein